MNDKKIQRGFTFAKEASEMSTFKQHHLGAVLMYKGNVLARGFNSYRSSPIQKEYNKERGFDVERWQSTLHAEIHCLSKVNQLDIDFSKANLFVYREYRKGGKALARPCPACMKMIKDLGIKNIYYTTPDGFAQERIENL